VRGTPTRAEKFAKLVGKMVCFLMVCTLVAFSVRLHWNTIHMENGSGFIVLSNPPLVGWYFAGAALICGIAWVILATGFKARPLSKQHQPRSGGM